jgi:hypothetical protein
MGRRLGIERNQPAKRRPNLAQGKRSAALGPVPKTSEPALAGDRNLPPAKAGSDHVTCLHPGFRSLRSLHPGLNSAVGFADSLSGFSQNHSIAADILFRDVTSSRCWKPHRTLQHS